MTFDRARRLLTGALTWALALQATDAFAQGCALCKINASQAPGGPQAMNTAILILLLPTLGIFVGILLRARRGR